MRMSRVVLAIVVGLAVAPTVRAQSHATIVPSVSMSTVYDDNIFARKDGDAGVMTRLRPAFEGNYESPTVTLLSLYAFDMQRSNFSALNSLDARRHGSFEIRHRTRPPTTLALGLQYDRTDTPGELNLDSGILGDRRQAERWEVVPSILHRIRPRTAFSGSYRWTTESLDQDTRGTLHVARTGVTRQTSTRDEVVVSYLGRLFVDVFERRTSHAALLGWNRDLALGTRLTLQGGPRFSSYRSVTPEIVAGVTRSTNRVRIGLDYWHGETIVLGIPGPVAVDSGTARLIFPISQRVELGTHVSVSDNSTIGGEDVRVYRGTFVASWTPRGGPYTFAGSYGADFQQGVIRRTFLSEDRVLRHTFRLNVTIAPRLSRSFRPTGERPEAVPQGVIQ
jgi:hypothetical protein